MDTAWRRAQDHPEPVVYKLEFSVFSDGFENSSDTGARPDTAATRQADATATDHRTATATAATTAGPGPGHSPGRYGPTTAPPVSSSPAVASSSPSSTAAADSFPRFLDLPPELRLRVWEELIQPRIIMVACCPASPASHPRRLAKLAQLRARQQRRRLFFFFLSNGNPYSFRRRCPGPPPRLPRVPRPGPAPLPARLRLARPAAHVPARETTTASARGAPAVYFTSR
ncbi:hypothetical protein MAPG_00017 [Magnaporthiopsis poae ATCC 64411]|uniref:2EXR domain-containing protein n=1 Tax=Magnaporthiopsis poae (strain ATCC 64411 / 73-15) TaxID=644358 RepID=A0A0C4DJV8_MAGP6|nr:hypothetical protein MAPG_00017 [Magnaporthiopsis poae ATCC 64411]